MPVLTKNRLAPYQKLIEDIDAAIGRGDEIGADMIRALFPEWHEAVDSINSALKEVDNLLFEGLRDEALGVHDPDLIAVATQYAVHDRPHWVEIAAWFAEMGLSDPPLVDTDAVSQIEAAHGEVDALQKGLMKLRRMALTRAPLSSKLSALRKLRTKDSTKLVWAKAIAAHEDACLREFRIDIKRALARADFDSLAEMHATLVAPHWESEVPRDLVRATRGADTAVALHNAIKQARDLAKDIESRWSASSGFTHVQCDRLLELRQGLTDAQGVIDECLRYLQDCPQILSAVGKSGLDTAFNELLSRLSGALQWIEECAARHAIHNSFNAECRRLEYLCDHLPNKAGESKWLADLQRSDSEIRRCCQQQPELIFPELLQERARRTQASITSRETLRTRFIVVVAASLVVIAGGGTAVAGYVYWKHKERITAIAALENAVNEARLGAYLERPPEIDNYAGTHGRDTSVSRLLREFDECIEVEKNRRSTFREHIVGHKELIEAAAAAVADRKAAASDDARLAAWPEPFVTAAQKLAQARNSGGRPETQEADTPLAIPASTQRQHEAEEQEIATCEAAQEKLDVALELIAADAFTRLRDELRDLIPENQADDADAAAKLILSRVHTLRSLGASKKAEGLPAPMAEDTRIPTDLLKSLDILEKRLETIVKSKQ